VRNFLRLLTPMTRRTERWRGYDRYDKELLRVSRRHSGMIITSMERICIARNDLVFRRVEGSGQDGVPRTWWLSRRSGFA
jgi:hypothetical protein